MAEYAPPHPSAWAELTYALCTLSLAYPALVGKFMVMPHSDQYKAGYAFRHFAATTLKATGAFPQWEPYLFGGMPYVAAMHGDIFYPTFLLRMVLPTDVAITWGMILHFVLCGLATYWFMRHAARLSFFASLVGGVAYMMGGFVSSLVSAGHDGKLFVSALFPVTLLMVTFGVRDGRRWAWGVLAVVVGLAVLSPHPQLLQYLLLTAGAWALFLAFGGVGAEKLARPDALKRLGLAFVAVVIGGAIGAVQYLPVMEYTSWSPRAAGLPYDTAATSYSFPIEELINTYLPQFSGILENYWGRNRDPPAQRIHRRRRGTRTGRCAAFGAGWTGARKRFFWFWIGTGIVSLLWALGGYTPFYQLVYVLVPGTKHFRARRVRFSSSRHSRLRCWRRSEPSGFSGRLGVRYAYGWLIGAAAVTLFALAGGFTALGNGLLAAPQLAGALDASAGPVRVGALRSFVFAAVVCGGIILLARRMITPPAAGWALVVLCAIDLWTIERLYWGFVAPASVIYASDPIVDFLRKQKEPTRVLVDGVPELPMTPGDPFLTGDALMVHGIRIVDGYHGNELGRYRQIEPDLLSPSIWALMNTDFLLINTDSVPFAGVKRVLGPVKNAAGTNYSLFSLPGAHPFAWVAPAIAKYPDAAVLTAVQASNFPTFGVALFDPSSAVQGQDLKAIPAPLALTATATTYEPGHIVIALNGPAPKGSALVVSENYYPGWQATVDGKPATVDRADYVIMGVPLPEGAKQVELTFSSRAYEHGKIITLIALAVAVALGIGGAVTGRRPVSSAANA